jgi:hypothetical protein
MSQATLAGSQARRRLVCWACQLSSWPDTRVTTTPSSPGRPAVGAEWVPVEPVLAVLHVQAAVQVQVHEQKVGQSAPKVTTLEHLRTLRTQATPTTLHIAYVGYAAQHAVHKYQTPIRGSSGGE